MIREGTSRWAIATAVMALVVGGFAFASSASAGPKANKPAVVTVDAVPTDQSVTITYSINRAHKAIASQTCTLDDASTPCDTSPNSATGKPVKTTYAVTINGLANGQHTFAVSFRLADGNGGSNSDTFTINYTPPNRAPIAVDDAVTMLQGTSVTINIADLLSNDSDPDGDPFTIFSVGAAYIGTVVFQPGGTVRYTPPTGYVGTDSFPYQVTDGRETSVSATVTITVTADPYLASRIRCENEPFPGTFFVGTGDPILWSCDPIQGSLPVEYQEKIDALFASCVAEGGRGSFLGLSSGTVFCLPPLEN